MTFLCWFVVSEDRLITTETGWSFEKVSRIVIYRPINSHNYRFQVGLLVVLPRTTYVIKCKCIRIDIRWYYVSCKTLLINLKIPQPFLPRLKFNAIYLTEAMSQMCILRRESNEYFMVLVSCPAVHNHCGKFSFHLCSGRCHTISHL